MKSKKTILISATCCFLALAGSAMAHDEEVEAAEVAVGVEEAVEAEEIAVEAVESDESDLAATIQNPLATLVSLPLQFNFNEGVDPGAIAGGDREGGERFFNLNVQPVIPFPGEKWNIITRTIIPVNSVPLGDNISEFGIGDTSLSIFWSPAKASRLTWGIGPALSLPTASNPEILGSGKFSVGPTAVVFYGISKWTMGFVASNVWSVAGDEDRNDINFFLAQWFVNYNIGRGWAVGTAPIVTANWEDEDSGNRWTVPLGLQVSKVTHFGSRPVNLLIGYYDNVQHPDGAAEYQIRFQLNLLFPQGPK